MGVSQFDWTDSGAQSLTLDLHTQRHTLNKARLVFASESLDRSVIEVISVGSSVNDVTVTISAERDATGLRDLRDAMVRAISLTYTPDLDAPGTTFTVTAVPGSVSQIAQESEGAKSPRFMMTVTLRRLDGGAFWPAS